MRERGEIPSALCLVPPVQQSFGFARGPTDTHSQCPEQDRARSLRDTLAQGQRRPWVLISSPGTAPGSDQPRDLSGCLGLFSSLSPK